MIANLRTARKWGVPLSVFSGEREPGSLWTTKDSQLALALEEYEAGLCSGCGQPLHLSTSIDTYGCWECEPIQCFSCETRDAVATKIADDKEQNPYPSSYRYGTRLNMEKRERARRRMEASTEE